MTASGRTWLLRALVLLGLLALGWWAGSCMPGARARTWPRRTGRIRVLTTILPLYSFARQIGGPDVDVRNLLPPGVDPHEFSLSPHDISLVTGADVLVANGGGLDDFLVDALRKAQVAGKPTVWACDGLPMLASSEKEEEHEGHHESGDPHLWLDPVFARTYARRVAAELVASAERQGYHAAAERMRARAAALDAALAQLDRDYRQALAPLAGRSFIAFHGAFAYLARRYGLTVAAVWQTTPGREPAPREVGALLDTVHRTGVRALFAEPQFSARALEIIASDARLPVYTLDPMETSDRFDRAAYVPIMRANLATLVRALGR